MFHLSHSPPHWLRVTSAGDGSLLGCYHPWEYIHFGTGYFQGFIICYDFRFRSEGSFIDDPTKDFISWDSRSFSWSDSLGRTPPIPKSSPWLAGKAGRQIILDWILSESSASSFFWLYGPAGAGKTAILQEITEFLCSPSGSDQNFWGSFFFSRGRDQGQWFSVLNNCISTRSESTWTTSTCQSYYGFRSNTSYKVNGRTVEAFQCLLLEMFAWCDPIRGAPPLPVEFLWYFYILPLSTPIFTWFLRCHSIL